MGLEAIKLVDNLHLGGYWPVGDQATRSRRPPPRLGVETERGYWEENLPRELSMGDQGSRQLTPHPSPPRLDTEQLGTLDNALTGTLAYALGDAPGNQPDAPTLVPSPTPVPHLGPAGHARGVGRSNSGNKEEEALMLGGTNYDSRMNRDAPEFRHLPASRTWDTDEVLALQLDRARPPHQNLIVIGYFCPDMAGEDEPGQMEDTPLATTKEKTQ